MSNINVYPFTRKIVLEQKSQQEQNALMANVNKNVNPLVTPADYTPVIVTNQPVAGVTDQLRTMKPSISVIEETYAPVTPTVEKEVKTTVAGAWETLTFDYSAINTSNTYQKIVLIFDLGTVGDGSANFTFLFDDITLN